jgi:hypothetical protein
VTEAQAGVARILSGLPSPGSGARAMGFSLIRPGRQSVAPGRASRALPILEPLSTSVGRMEHALLWLRQSKFTVLRSKPRTLIQPASLIWWRNVVPSRSTDEVTIVSLEQVDSGGIEPCAHAPAADLDLRSQRIGLAACDASAQVLEFPAKVDPGLGIAVAHLDRPCADDPTPDRVRGASGLN